MTSLIETRNKIGVRSYEAVFKMQGVEVKSKLNNIYSSSINTPNFYLMTYLYSIT